MIRARLVIAAGLAFASASGPSLANAIEPAQTATVAAPAPFLFDQGLDVSSEAESAPPLARWWFWGVVGAVAAGIVVTGLVLTDRP